MIVYHELTSIEADLDISAKTLYSISNNISSHYHSVNIPKKSGEVRTLNVPDEALKKVQRAIAEKLLVLEPVSCYATAYKPASGIVSNAKPHIGKEKILKLDIRNFFDSIKYSAVKEKAFPKERYSESIRILLAMLCYYGDILPQGAPTSPTISNIIMYDFDNTVGKYCNERKISYTRYCDDMTFSGDLDNICELTEFVEHELKKSGFVLNKQKTKAVGSSHRQTVTGIVVNEKANISKEYKHEIRKNVYFIKKFGIASHIKRLGITQSPGSYLSSLLGKINFVLQIRPDDRDFKEYKAAIIKEISQLSE